MRLVYKTLLPIVAVLGITILVAGVFLRHSLENTLFKEQFLRTQEIVIREARDSLTRDVFADPASASSTATFEFFVAETKDTTTARITVWDTENRIVYSDLAAVIGATSPDHPDLARVSREHASFFNRKTSDTNFPQQSAVGEFIDMYIPIMINGEYVGIVEIQSVAEAVLGPLASELNTVVYVFLGSGILILLVIVAVFNIFILGPIERASALARDVSRGQFEPHQIPIHDDEIGGLVKNLDSMRERLKLLVGNLEGEVATRTRKLEEEETRLSASLGSLSVGLAIVDPDGTVFYANDPVRKLLALTGPLTVETFARRFGTACDVRSLFQAAITEKKVSDLKEIELDRLFLRVFCAPVVMQHAREEVLGAVILIDDVTDEKQLERSKEEFLTIASHELRTPLAAIRANASLLKQIFTSPNTEPKVDTTEIAEDIHAASIRLIKIVHDFLDVSALEQKVVSIKLEPLDVLDTAQEVTEQLKGLAKEKNIGLAILPPTTPLPKVAADRDRLKQVITNLVGNAINNTAHGSVTVSAEPTDAHVIVRVQDTGIGISSANQSLLFKKFQQAGTSVMSREITQGTGLGLYISKLIVESMGGHIQLDASTPGQGSVFSVTLPRATV
jgi:two-component system sensor histidine kinase ResE